MDLFRGISSPWCFSERSAVGVPYQNEISASSMKIVKLLSSSDVLKDTTCFERTKYKLFGTDHYFSSGGRGGGGDKNCFVCKKLIFSFLQQQTIYVGVYIQFISVYCACKKFFSVFLVLQTIYFNIFRSPPHLQTEYSIHSTGTHCQDFSNEICM